MEEGRAKIVLMYIQNPKVLPSINSLFTLIPEALQFITSTELLASGVA